MAATLAMLGADRAYAQAGIGVQQNATVTGTIGSNKGDPGTGAVACPSGQIMTGIYHRDKGVGGTSSTVGMSAQVGIYCSTVATDGNTVTLTQTTSNGTPGASTSSYNFALAPQSAYCNTNLVGRSFFGTERNTSNAPWTSSIGLNCAAITVSAGTNWFDVPGPDSQSITAGTIETPLNHVNRGPFCGTAANPLVTGLFAQAGGEGWDGLNVYCGRLIQARHSAIMTFSDFAWDKTLSATGWRVDLRRGSTLLVSGTMTGSQRIPYAAAANNGQGYNSASEVYVVPNSGYGAIVSGRPSAFAGGAYDNAYVTTGSCVTGITLTDRQDSSCTLNVDGRPDLTPTVVSPPQTYTVYGQTQPVTITVSNLGPGATVAGDQFRVRATIPTNWVASNLPTGCTQAANIVTCSVGALNAAASPGATGGTQSYTFNVAPASPAATGTFNMPVEVDPSIPNGDSDSANNDYNAANNTTNGTLVLALNATLRLSKTWVNANVGDTAQLSATSSTTPSATLTTTASTPSESLFGSAVQAPLGAQFNLSETLGASNVGRYNASAWSCNGGTVNGAVLTIAPGDSGRLVTCSITNTRQGADVRVTKTTSTPTVRSGQNIVWTITAVNAGPDAANNTVLQDTPGAGMDCSVTPPPTCTATGGATCPSNITAQTLASGVTIPTFPNGGQVVVTLTCRATASGL
ncbi:MULTISPECIES: hypothetical protein [unclassified Brevundimonas]|uniref:hypothetical protein n=1 Tax=unclassified Brevundimonas TaxID=2622653 RepID=UPI0025C3CAEB|nr:MULTISPECIES: hypothetical protein [unclassified Brevundimonas]